MVVRLSGRLKFVGASVDMGGGWSALLFLTVPVFPKKWEREVECTLGAVQMHVSWFFFMGIRANTKPLCNISKF